MYGLVFRETAVSPWNAFRPDPGPHQVVVEIKAWHVR